MRASNSFRTFFIASFLASLCAAWGYDGHKIVAQIAENRLNSAAVGHLRRFLVGSGLQQLWQVSTLPDDYCHSDAGKWSKGSHFVNLDRNSTRYEAKFCKGTCAVDAIGNYTARIVYETRSDYCVYKKGEESEPCPLEFLTHYIGDIHQPLHVSYEDDWGGNAVHVNITFLPNSEPTNLHSVWDYHMINRYLNGRNWTSLADELINTLRKSPEVARKYEQNLNPEDWANESFSIVRGVVYKFRNQTIDETYYQNSMPIILQRLMAAGVRLAKLLNKIAQ